MIAIIDGGSTKCDWVLITPEGKETARWVTTGLNPNHISKNQIIEVLQNQDYTFPVSEVKSIYFYGSGCGIEKNQKVLAEALEGVFPMANITVKEDMLGAAYAVYNGSPALVAILGTGSNICFFDGEKIRLDIPSLAFIMGDEGSGSALGKALVKNFFMKKLPQDLHEAFASEYGLTIEELIQRLYHQPKANAFLASFNGFLVKHKAHAFVQQLIKEEFKHFLYFQASAYPESSTLEIHCVGSIAMIYSDLLREVAQEMGMKIGNIIQKPIDGLVDYHRKKLGL